MLTIFQTQDGSSRAAHTKAFGRALIKVPYKIAFT